VKTDEKDTKYIEFTIEVNDSSKKLIYKSYN